MVDEFDKAIISLGVIVGAGVISVIVAKIVDICYDRASISDDASDVSDHTRNLIRARLAVMRFRSKKDEKTEKTPTESEAHKQKAAVKMLRVWSAKSKMRKLSRPRDIEAGEKSDTSKPADNADTSINDTEKKEPSKPAKPIHSILKSSNMPTYVAVDETGSKSENAKSQKNRPKSALATTTNTAGKTTVLHEDKPRPKSAVKRVTIAEPHRKSADSGKSLARSTTAVKVSLTGEEKGENREETTEVENEKKVSNGNVENSTPKTIDVQPTDKVAHQADKEDHSTPSGTTNEKKTDKLTEKTTDKSTENTTDTSTKKTGNVDNDRRTEDHTFHRTEEDTNDRIRKENEIDKSGENELSILHEMTTGEKDRNTNDKTDEPTSSKTDRKVSDETDRIGKRNTKPSGKRIVKSAGKTDEKSRNSAKGKSTPGKSGAKGETKHAVISTHKPKRKSKAAKKAHPLHRVNSDDLLVPFNTNKTTKVEERPAHVKDESESSDDYEFLSNLEYKNKNDP